jgi:hypothetical protein
MPQVLLHAASGRKQAELDNITERLTPEPGEIGFGIAEMHPEIIRVKVQSGDGFSDFVF